MVEKESAYAAIVTGAGKRNIYVPVRQKPEYYQQKSGKHKIRYNFFARKRKKARKNRM